MLSEVCHNVSIEPHLQPLSGETMSLRSANTEDNSRLDIAAYGFWGSRFERAFFDVRVFNPCARSNRQTSLLSTYRRHEQEKKRQYDQRIREVEHSTFTPLVLSTTGGMGRAATTFYKRLAAMLSEKKDVPYSKMIGWICCRMSFSLLRASIMSIRGTRSSAPRGALREPIELQATEGQQEYISTRYTTFFFLFFYVTEFTTSPILFISNVHVYHNCIHLLAQGRTKHFSL